VTPFLIAAVAIAAVVLLVNGWRVHRAWTSLEREARRFRDRR
jgi:hypothetical protein